ncbi:MAG: hypothetical protein AAGC55_27190, partial [Myxococcota bacterium]
VVLDDRMRVRCWGYNSHGQLGQGLGDEDSIGDDEHPSAVADVDLGLGLGLGLDEDRCIAELAAGEEFTCALIASECGGGCRPEHCDRTAVRCWGDNERGQLGIGDSSGDKVAIGDQAGEMPPADTAVLGPSEQGKVVQIAAGDHHVCARLDKGQVRCWGENSNGRLGIGDNQGDRMALGDQPGEMPPPDVALGSTSADVVVGECHTCARSTSSEVRCWGEGELGQLGYRNGETIGDEDSEMPPGDNGVRGSAGQSISAMTTGRLHTCVLMAGGEVVRCWGAGYIGGTLGHGSLANYGNEAVHEMPPRDTPVLHETDTVHIGELTAGTDHTCATLDSGVVRCWGHNSRGQLGIDLSNNQDIGDDPGEMPPQSIVFSDDRRVIDLALGFVHSCAVLDNGRVRCWGGNTNGQLGYADTVDRRTPGPDVDYLPGGP